MNEKYLHPTLPGMSKVEMLESMGRDGIVDHILLLSERGQQIQTDINLAADVLEGAYGVSFEAVLEERKNDGDPAA